MNSAGFGPGKRLQCNYFVTAKAGQNKTRSTRRRAATRKAALLTASTGDDPPSTVRASSPSLDALIGRAGRAGKGAPPVEMWNPPFCGEIDMVIRSDGRWDYCGSPIGREALVRLFASVLRKDEDGRTYLVTPVERLGITVEDAPFLAVEMSRDDAAAGPVLTFRTNVGDVAAAGPGHPLRFSFGGAGESFEPYILVRGRLEAKLTRSLAYDLADFVEEDEDGSFLRSGGVRFPLGGGA